jgi:hypothetical protein
MLAEKFSLSKDLYSRKIAHPLALKIMDEYFSKFFRGSTTGFVFYNSCHHVRVMYFVLDSIWDATVSARMHSYQQAMVLFMRRKI